MKGRLTKIFIGAFFIALGVCMALDLTGTSMLGIGRIWTASLLGVVFLAVLIKYLLTKRNYLPLVVPLGYVSALVIVAEVSNLTFAELWPLLPMGITVSLLIYCAMARMVKSTVIFTYMTVLLAGVLAGLIAGVWVYVLPALCVLTGVLALLPIWKKGEPVPDIPMRSFVQRREELMKDQNFNKEV